MSLSKMTMLNDDRPCKEQEPASRAEHHAEIVELQDDNLDLYHQALEAAKDDQTCRILTEISNKEAIIYLATLFDSSPLGWEKKTMRQLAKKADCNVIEFGKAWKQLLILGAFQNKRYAILETRKSDQLFLFAVDVESVLLKHDINQSQVVHAMHRFDIR